MTQKDPITYYDDKQVHYSDRRKVNKEEEEASTHKSAKTHAGNVFVTRDLDLLTPK